jgi:molybdopterin-guanine dinucleotide biosynthesis protein MobB
MAPIVISVIGLKKSGKTSVVEGIVAELRRRGYVTGTIKSMVHSSFSFDMKGKDTYRHGGAGAEFVISLSRDQTVYLERHDPGHADLGHISRLFPLDAQFVICEGFEEKGAIARILALREAGDFHDALGIRNADRRSIIAVSGLVATKAHTVEGLRTYDIMDRGGRVALCDLLVAFSGDPVPKGVPGGPSLTDPDWRPGVLPPGCYPEVPDIEAGGVDH